MKFIPRFVFDVCVQQSLHVMSLSLTVMGLSQMSQTEELKLFCLHTNTQCKHKYKMKTQRHIHKWQMSISRPARIVSSHLSQNTTTDGQTYPSKQLQNIYWLLRPWLKSFVHNKYTENTKYWMFPVFVGMILCDRKSTAKHQPKLSDSPLTAFASS